MNQVLAFLGVSVLVIVTPGPDTAVTIRSTLMGGRRAGVLTATGVITGQACWTLAASAGITALLVASEPAFMALKFAGAAYLVYLGLQAQSFWLMLGFGLLFCLLTWLWLVLYAATVDRLGHLLRRSGLRRAIEAAMGAVLVALGVRLAAEPRHG